MRLWHEAKGDNVPVNITELDDMLDLYGTDSIGALFPGDILIEPDEIARAMSSGNPDEYIKSQVADS